MDIRTRYNLGQEVISIKEERSRIWIRCTFCEGSNKPTSMLNRSEITGRDGKIVRCPICKGDGGEWKIVGKIWVVGHVLTIGQIEVRIRSFEFQEEKREEKYMCIETGIGGGRLWSVDRLFPTEKEALAECAKRNKDVSHKESSDNSETISDARNAGNP